MRKVELDVCERSDATMRKPRNVRTDLMNNLRSERIEKIAEATLALLSALIKRLEQGGS